MFCKRALKFGDIWEGGLDSLEERYPLEVILLYYIIQTENEPVPEVTQKLADKPVPSLTLVEFINSSPGRLCETFHTSSLKAEYLWTLER